MDLVFGGPGVFSVREKIDLVVSGTECGPGGFW